ncbi:MAG: LPS export ABC transporter permease LptG [Gammaproteobacteria bacterium]|uniref:LPS export ABC transporter permease LptG n=1 Tax=Rhodoferax sp. TaxID=50421 RepID=UPI00178E2B14|nr:LPS export ABC transporter permease LptG [Rhodoferax sp.]MBU3899864.1 LPS export ABC transporter permease LptG [Gammaproteobacteria bacterium]MBA3058199.1 LPS export ABC transporter permease LptG [Rhodoferax sp.]MBU3996047.1 LPS export ABC transporter permease LptG [Gammaproteobacteria bacterium]MBU4019129.1 LPS export ABC transporter permease LptG [Gammaproteobacteria bacterium]MBU4078847.1 LPS export ABC transporter permease LptG [Gammaproteobacteria bacterium]
MKTIRRLIYGEVLYAVAFVTLGFLSLFFFFDFVEEVQAVGRYAAAGYRIVHALSYVALMIPSHLYELLPIAVLIGTIFVMARFAQSSEFTILRTSGLGPWRALRALLLLGLGFVALTFAIGDYLSPPADRAAQLLKARYQGSITVGQTGAWLKEQRADGQYAVNVRSMAPDGSMSDVRVFEFDSQGFLRSTLQAESAQFGADDAWQMAGVRRTDFPARGADTARIDRAQLASYRWPNQISAEMVAAALLKPKRMSTIDLFQYIRHLQANSQTAQRYEIEFWRKVFYPLSCLVMVVLALPFAYLHFRSGGIANSVFGGVMAGISFFLLNNVFGYMGNLQNWQPWLTAALPGMIYLALSLTAFGWLVLRR